MKSILLISAAPFEVHDFVSVLNSKNQAFEYASCGIGPLNATSNARDLAEKSRNRDVIFVGTCGTFGEFSKVELCTAQKIVWLPPCVREGVAELIEGVYPPINIPERGPYAVGPAKTVLCCSSIGSTDTIPTSLMLGPADNLVENLELYSCVGSILQTCKSLSIILGITNHVGPKGRKQWRENFKLSAAISADHIKNLQA